ncbi:hypothetical protein GCM10022223_16400 [Kineosporia mesophila]|uniref:Carrier domain-containing protein n=1 Tax=Kineosporia mesophila TaxID=566012 RepID=A0ABP6Z9H7_9ACTN
MTLISSAVPTTHDDPVRMFLAATRRAPGRPAVLSRREDLTFGEVDRRSARAASALRHEHGVRPGDRVGVHLARGPELIVAFLAIWRAGAAYVPLDPAHPAERLRYLAQDAEPRLVLTRDPAPTWAGTAGWVTPERLDGAPERGADDERPVPVGSPAYVIYTSGSTGLPKGVEVSRANVSHLQRALSAAGVYSDTPRVVAWNASMSFDASVQQWARVCRGDTVVVLDDELRQDPAALAAYLEQTGVNDLDVTPSHWQVLEQYVAPVDRPFRLLIGGEAIPADLWDRLLTRPGNLDAFNVYGPTECTVDAVAARITAGEPRIGRPLPGMTAHVLDTALRPAGEGELYLSGPGLATGYRNRRDLTATRFVADPFGPEGGRMYRTGDRVRYDPGGELVYLGRTDRQVKIRGHRVEPAEIEEAVSRHREVTSTAVQMVDDVLVAYYTGEVTVPPLRHHVAGILPEPLVPASFIRLEQFPLTVSGKIDRDALPAPDRGPDPSATALAGPTEHLIAEVWAQVLGRSGISATDDFFALGGHSLMALKLVARLKRDHGIAVSSRLVYQHPRLRDLAAVVDTHR